LKEKVPTKETTLVSNQNRITVSYNNFVKKLALLWDDSNLGDRVFLQNHFIYVRLKLERAYEKLGCKYKIPKTVFGQVDASMIQNSESESEFELEEIPFSKNIEEREFTVGKDIGGEQKVEKAKNITHSQNIKLQKPSGSKNILDKKEIIKPQETSFSKNVELEKITIAGQGTLVRKRFKK